ncbi:hypothetical protein BG004_007686 [Podila humilis]|nr:hypothetical protein BG004_007686 [Podila humilis]
MAFMRNFLNLVESKYRSQLAPAPAPAPSHRPPLPLPLPLPPPHPHLQRLAEPDFKFIVIDSDNSSDDRNKNSNNISQHSDNSRLGLGQDSEQSGLSSRGSRAQSQVTAAKSHSSSSVRLPSGSLATENTDEIISMVRIKQSSWPAICHRCPFHCPQKNSDPKNDPTAARPSGRGNDGGNGGGGGSGERERSSSNLGYNSSSYEGSGELSENPSHRPDKRICRNNNQNDNHNHASHKAPAIPNSKNNDGTMATRPPPPPPPPPPLPAATQPTITHSTNNDAPTATKPPVNTNQSTKETQAPFLEYRARFDALTRKQEQLLRGFDHILECVDTKDIQPLANMNWSRDFLDFRHYLRLNIKDASAELKTSIRTEKWRLLLNLRTQKLRLKNKLDAPPPPPPPPNSQHGGERPRAVQTNRNGHTLAVMDCGFAREMDRYIFDPEFREKTDNQARYEHIVLIKNFAKTDRQGRKHVPAGDPPLTPRTIQRQEHDEIMKILDEEDKRNNNYYYKNERPPPPPPRRAISVPLDDHCQGRMRAGSGASAQIPPERRRRMSLSKINRHAEGNWWVDRRVQQKPVPASRSHPGATSVRSTSSSSSSSSTNLPPCWESWMRGDEALAEETMAKSKVAAAQRVMPKTWLHHRHYWMLRERRKGPIVKHDQSRRWRGRI